MADTAQINPKIKLATKVRLMEFCKERGHAQGDVVTAALEAYLTPADGDAQALLFQKVNGLEQGMKDVVTLLGSVIQHLEKQTKPLPPKVATRDELYPGLAPSGISGDTFQQLRDSAPLIDVEALRDEEPSPPASRPFWRRLGRREAP